MATRYWIGTTNSWNTATNWNTQPNGSGTTGIPAANDVVIFNNAASCNINTNTASLASVNFTGWTGSLSGTSTLTVAGGITFPASSGASATQFIGYTGTISLTGTAASYNIATNGYLLACNITITAAATATTSTIYNFTDYLVTSGKVTISKGFLKFSGSGTNSNGTFNASVGVFSISSTVTTNYRSVECNNFSGTRAIELTRLTSVDLLDITSATALQTFDIQNIYITGNSGANNRYIIGNNAVQLENVYFRYTGTGQHGFGNAAAKVTNVYLGNTAGNFYTYSGSTLTNVYFESSTGNWTGGAVNINGNVVLTNINNTAPGTKPSITIQNLTFLNGATCQFTSNGVGVNNNSQDGPFIVNGANLTFTDAVVGTFTSTGLSAASLVINSGSAELKENAAFFSIYIGNDTTGLGNANLITSYGKNIVLYYNSSSTKFTIGQFASSTITIKATLIYAYAITVASGKTLTFNEPLGMFLSSSGDFTGWANMTINGTLNLLKGSKEEVTENGNITISSTGVLNVGKPVQYPFWQGGHSYSLGDIIIPTSVENGYYYEATSIIGDGLSSDEEPYPWATSGTVDDFQVTWTPKSLTTAPIGDIRFFDLTITGGKATFYNNIRSHRAISLSGGSATEFNTFAGKQLTSSYVAASVGLITNSVTGKTITIPADISNRKGITTSSASNLLFTGKILKAGAITVNVNSTLTFTPPTEYPDVIGSGDLVCYGTLNINGNYTVQGAVNTFAVSGALAATWTNPGTTAYTLGTLKVPTVPNGFIYEVTTAGLGSSSEPGTNGTAPWPTTVGQTVQSNVAVFTCRKVLVTITGNLSVYYFRINKGGNFVNSDNNNIILGAGNVIHDIGNNNTTTLKGSVTCTGAFTNTSGNLIVNGSFSVGAFTNTTGSLDIKGVASTNTLTNSGTTTFRENVATSDAVTNTGALLDFKKDLIITTYSMSNTTGNFYVNGNLQVNQITNNSGNMILGESVSDSSTTASFIGTIANSVLTVTNITGTISIGDVLKNSYTTTPSFPSTTITITGFLTGQGGVGTYSVSTASTYSLTTKTWLYTCNPNGKYLNINGNILHNDGVITINYEINPPLKRLESSIDSAYKLAKGTVNFNNNCYLYRFDAWNSTNIRVINIASGKTISVNAIGLTPSNNFLGGAWAAYVTANLTVNALGSTIKLTGLYDMRFGAIFNGGYNVTPVINNTDNIITSYTRNTNINYGTLIFKVLAGSNWYILGSNVFENIIVDSLENPLAPAHNLYIENLANIITNDFRVNGSVTKKITIGTASTTASTDGQTPPYNYTIAANINAYHYLLKTNDNANNITVNNLTITHSAVTPSAQLGTPVWYASNSINGVSTAPTPVNSGWTFVNQRYWVGGTGTWTSTDTSKWAATKGGAPGVSVPTSNEDVVFDDCPAPTWKKNTAYAIGSIVSPTYDNTVDPPTSNATGYYYYAVIGGTSASTEPNWPSTFNPTTPSANQFIDNNITWETRRAAVTISSGAVGRTLTFKGVDGESHYRGSILGTQGMSISGSVTLGDYAPGANNPADYTGLDFSGYTGTLTLIGSGSSELITSGRQISFPLVFTLAVSGTSESVCVINEYFQTTPGTTVTINRGIIKFLGVSDTPSDEDPNIYYNASIGFLVTSATTYRKLYFDNLELIGGATSGNHTFWDSTTSTSGTLEISADTQGITPTIYIAGILYTGGFKSIRANTTYAIPANVVFYGGAPTVGYCTAAAKITNTIFKIPSYFSSTNISLFNGSTLAENYDFGTTYGNWNQVVGSGSLTVNKGLTLSPNMTCSSPLDLIISTGTGGIECDFITNGITFNGGITMTTGTLNFMEETTKIEFITATSNPFTKVINFYSNGTLELVGASASTPTWNFPNTITNLNLVNLSSSIIKFTNTTSTALIFEGGDRSYGTVWFNRNATTATGLITIRGNNSFVYFKDGNEYDEDGNIITTLVNGLEVPVYSNIPAHTIAFTDGTTQQIQNFLVNGQAATTGGVSRKITLDNTGTGTTNFYLNNTNTTSDVFCYYLTVQNSTVTPYDINNPEDYHWTASASNAGTGANTGWQILDDRFWVGGTATAGNYLWSTAANWSLTPGGTGGAGAPTKLSNAYFTSHSSLSVTITAGAKCYNLDCDNPDYGTYTGQFLGNHGVGTEGFGVYGNIRLCPNLIPSDGTGWTGQWWSWWGTSGKTNFIDYNGAITRMTSGVLINWVGSSGTNVVTTYKLKSDIENTGSGNFNLYPKTIFNTSPDGGITSYNVTCNTISSSNSADTYIYLNKSKIYLTASGDAWTFTGDPTNIVAGESEIILTHSTTATNGFTRFYGGNKTYYDLTFLRDSGSKSRCYIGGNNTFHNINIVGGGQTNVYFEGANNLPNTTTITNILNIEGTSGNVVTIQSVLSGTTPQWNLIAAATAPIHVQNYVTVLNSNAATTPGKFYTGAGGSATNSPGWNTPLEGGKKQLLLLGVGQ